MDTSSSPSKKRTVEIQANTSTPHGATIRLTVEYRIRPPVVSHVDSFIEGLSMEKTVDINMGTHGQQSQQASYQYVGGSEGLHYASSTSRQTTEQLPPRHLPVERLPDAERARLTSISPISTDAPDKSGGVLVRDTIVQHVSEDEKSTTSEEVVFEEWSEEFLCRRTDEFDRRTNRLLRSIIDETSARVKGDVIKEEYREKNERIKGHRSYDIVKEVYRRVPATSSTLDQTQSHLYEEIPQPPPHPTPLSPPPPSRPPLPIEHTKRESTYSPTSRNRHWSTEDIYTTTIVTDRPRDTSHVHADRLAIKDDSSTPPSSTIAPIYDRVRPGQFPPLPPTAQAVPSTSSSSSTYDRISTIVGPTQRYADLRPHPHEREQTVSEEYHVEVEQRHTDHRFSPQTQRPGSFIGGIPQREDSSEEDASDAYQGLSRIINEAGRKPFAPTSTSTVRETSDWRTKLKQIHTPTAEEDRFEQFHRSREITNGKTVTTPEERPQPPKRSSSSSSIIDERRARFEQQQIESSTGPGASSKIDRPSFGRVGELKNAFETTTTTGNGTPSKYTSPTTNTGLTEQRRRMFEEQEQTKKDWTATTTTRRPIIEHQADERRMSETHTAPSRVQPTDRLGRTGFDAVKSSLESSMIKTTQPSINITIKDKRTISSIDSDLSGTSPPIHQSTPKSKKQHDDDDAGHESEDELSDPMAIKQDQQQQFDINRRRSSRNRLRDFSQSTAQTIERKPPSTFNESNMENLLSHVPTSKGKGLLIELSPHISQEPPMTSVTTRSTREPYKPLTGSDSGIFEYSTATSHSHHHPISSSSIMDDTARTPTVRDSGVYVDSAATTSSRYGRRQASDTDLTTHAGDDSVSRSTYRYDTETTPTGPISSSSQQRNVRRQITGTLPSDYDNLANYRSGTSTQQRKVPITTQSRSTKPLVVDEIETIETETRVECQVQRTHEIEESTTKLERTSSPSGGKKVITTTTTTTTTTSPIVAQQQLRTPESSSDETATRTTPSRRVLLNERPQYYDSTQIGGSPLTIRQTYRESGGFQHRYESPQSDSVSYPSVVQQQQQDESVRVEEIGFKPIQRDRSQDSLRVSPSARSNIRTLSSGPRAMHVTSLSPENQVTFGKYTPNEIIAIVRVPELSQSPAIDRSLRHGTSEPELYARAREEQQQQDRLRLQSQRVHAASYHPSAMNDETGTVLSQRVSRSRIGPHEFAHEHSSTIVPATRSSSYHSALHEHRQQQQQQQQLQPQQQQQQPFSPSSTFRSQTSQHRSGSLGNLFGSNIEFEIEIQKRPPQQPEQPTVVALDQSSRAIVTTSRDGRVSIQNVAARPGNTVVINSDFHSSDRSLNRSSGYFSSDELRSQGINTNYSSDEQSSGGNQASSSSNIPLPAGHIRRYKNNDQIIASRLPAHYRARHQQSTDNFDRVNQIVQRYRQSQGPSTTTSTTGFNEAIDQIDALYNNLDIETNEDYYHDRLTSNNGQSQSKYDFSKSSPASGGSNRRKNPSHNGNSEYSKRYSSTGFQQIPTQYEQDPQHQHQSTVHHLVSTLAPNNTEYDFNRRRTPGSGGEDSHRALSDNENIQTEQHRPRESSSLNDLVMATPIRPSQSLSSSGILADYATPGTTSPNSGFGSTQNIILQQNRLNPQAQIVQRNRATSVKQMKQKSAAKKKIGSTTMDTQGQYSEEDDSPLSDNGTAQQSERPSPPSRSSNFANRYQ